jgi:hypothetical protein
MYINNSAIKLPTDPNTVVWKYLDLSKFLDLLLSQNYSCHDPINSKINMKVLLANLLLRRLKLSIDNPDF